MRRKFSLYVPTLLLFRVTQVLWSLLLWLAAYSVSHAQAPPITPSGLNTQVSSPNTLPSGQTQYNITGGTRPSGGANLFHSFGDFNVPNNNLANFLNDSGLATSNILGRVTGGNLSNIFGTIQTTGFGGANLFLMNPAGFLFGSNATVNVGGMVAFTSADYMRLGDGKLFNAAPNPSADAVLSTAPVVAYGFLGSNPGAITVQGSQLTVTPGQSISLVGGDITIQSGALDNGTVRSPKLSAAGGQINLASVASPGEILTETLTQAPNINGQSFGTLGTIQVLEQSHIDASGNGGGTVLIRGGQFMLDNSTISANVTGPGPVINEVESIGGGIDIQVSGNAVIQNLGVLETNVANANPGVTYGGVHIKGDRIEILGTVTFEDAFGGTAGDIFSIFTGVHSNVGLGSTGGNSGHITLNANSILINNWAQVNTMTDGIGNAGNIILRANQNLDLPFGQISSGQSPLFEPPPVPRSGDAGSIELTSAQGNISLTKAVTITSQTIEGHGTVGTTTLNAPNGNILATDFTTIGPFIGIPTIRAGGSGGIVINANNLELANGSVITVTNLSNLPPGNITLNLSGSLTLRGGEFGGSSIQAAAQGPAPSAGLSVTAHDVFVTDAGSSLTTATVNSGVAGPLNISVVNLQLTNGGKISSASVQGIDPATGLPGGPPVTGDAGTVTIVGAGGHAQSVLIDGTDSGVFTNTVGTGTGGNINIFAESVTIQNGGTLSAATSGTVPDAGPGGAISVQANEVNLLTGGTMTAASSGAGASGEIVVQGLARPAQSILIDGSESGIFSDTSDTGAGGNISVNANSVTLQNSGTLSAVSAGTGPSATGGTITVNAEHLTLNSQAHINTDTNGIAPAGVVDINTGTLAINSGGQIRSSSGAETQQLRALALSPAPAQPLIGGTITVQGLAGTGSQADSVTIDGAGSGVFTESSGTRPGGDINILTSQSVAMTNGAHISSSSTGTGNAGNIQINAGNRFAMTNSSVTTEANQASGGAIKITTTPGGTVQLTDSTITASVLDGTGGGGSVDIDPQFVILQNSQILARAVEGPGGNISITTNLLLPDTTSIIDASSQFGQQGNIVIQSPVSPASGKLNPLGQKPLTATALVSQRCAALAKENASSFTVAGRDSLPAEPGGWVSSPLALSMAEFNESPATETALSSFSELEKGTPLLSLRKVAPAGFLTQNLGAASSDCQS
jgi:filamentous hemagglutinin family protein